MKQFEIIKFPRPVFNIEEQGHDYYEDAQYQRPENHEINDGRKTGWLNEWNKWIAENKSDFQNKPTAAIDSVTLAKMSFETWNEQRLAQEEMNKATSPDAGWPPVSMESYVGKTEWWTWAEKTRNA